MQLLRSCYIMVINLCSLTQSICLTIKWHSGDELVDSKLASEAENALNVPRPRHPVIWTSKDPNGRKSYYARSKHYIRHKHAPMLPTPHYA